MASLQQLAKEIAVAAASVNATIIPNVTSRPADVPVGPLGSLFTILSLLTSTSALRDSRRNLYSLWFSFVDTFFITAEFDANDTTFKWMLAWLSKQPSWREIRHVAVSTNALSVPRHPFPFPSLKIPTETLLPKKFFYLPAMSRSYTLWYKYHWIRVIRVAEQNRGLDHKETLRLKLFARSPKILDEILQEARQAWLETQQDSVTVYVSERENHWRCLAKRPKRPLSSIILDPGVQELLLQDAKDFLENRPWYQERGIPFRRGYLLYGTPGSGKTSVIHSIAGELCLDIYILSLSRSGLDDSSLATLLSSLPERCIVLMEDVDAAFHHGLNREAEEPPATSQNEIEPLNGLCNVLRNGRYIGLHNSPGKLSLSGILNAIDGVSANEGRILFATTNKYSVLDPALCRPGRMDIHIEFHSASKYQARELFKRFFSVASVSTTVTTEKGAEGKCESGGHVPDLIDLKTSEKSGDSSLSICGVSHWTRAPELSTGQLATLADQFAAAVPERQLSMAALQGYLM
ncbi:hypothetical protein ID866_10274, partial [Astraeus odoratus]